MRRLYRSHSASTIYRDRLSSIAASSVSKHPVSIYPRRRSRPNESRIHQYLSRPSDSSSLCQEVQLSSPSETDFPEDYITNLNSSRKQERTSNSTSKILEEPQEQQATASRTIRDNSETSENSQEHQHPTSSISNIPSSAMSSRRSGHSSSAKGSSRRQTSHVSSLFNFSKSIPLHFIFDHSLTFFQQSTAQLIESLNTRRVNTMTELRRIERIAAESSAEDSLAFQGPMTSAWNAYVTSNNMLNELRGLTRNYPFSSAALDDAKWRVSNDPESNRSWNYAWLVLVKLRDE